MSVLTDTYVTCDGAKWLSKELDGSEPYDCPTCNGRGRVIPEHIIEAAAWAIVTMDLDPHFVKVARRRIVEKARHQAEAALWAGIDAAALVTEPTR